MQLHINSSWQPCKEKYLHTLVINNINVLICMESSLEAYHGKSIATASQCHSACWVQCDASHHGPSREQ